MRDKKFEIDYSGGFLNPGSHGTSKNDHMIYQRVDTSKNILLLIPNEGLGDSIEEAAYPTTTCGDNCEQRLELALEAFHLKSRRHLSGVELDEADRNQAIGCFQKFRSVMFHNCLTTNIITRDTFFLVKHMITSILMSSPEITNYFSLIDINVKKDLLYKKDKGLKKNAAEIFIKFCKRLRELRLDYNLILNIANIDRVFDYNDFENIIYVIRASMPYLPSFLKFVFSISTS
jgi:hypothetical protein